MDEQRFEVVGQDGTAVRLVVHRPQGDAWYCVTDKNEVVPERGSAAPFSEAERRALVEHASRARRYPEPVEYFAFLVCDSHKPGSPPVMWTRPRRSIEAAAHDIHGRVTIPRPYEVRADSESAARDEFAALRPVPVED